MKLFEKVALIAGVLILGLLVYRIGPGALWAQISELSWGFLLVLGLHGVTVFVNTLGWRLTLPPERRSIPIASLAGMLIVGEAVNALTPAAVVGGDLMRISLLARRVPLETAVSSVGQAAMAQFISQVLFILAGVPLALTMLSNRGLRAGLLTLSAVLLLAVALVLYLGGSREGLARIRRRLEKIAWFRARWTAPTSRWRSFAEETLGGLRSRPRDFAGAVGFSFLAWLLGIVEVFLILHFLRAPVGWATALVIEVLSVAIEGVLFFVPAKIGTQEGGKHLIFLALGLDTVKGVALGFIRRLRGIVWAAAGLVVLGTFQAGPKQPQATPSDASPR